VEVGKDVLKSFIDNSLNTFKVFVYFDNKEDLAECEKLTIQNRINTFARRNNE